MQCLLGFDCVNALVSGRQHIRSTQCKIDDAITCSYMQELTYNVNARVIEADDFMYM